MNDIWDAAIIGAGPSGCAAAITLARAGQRVVMVDRARFPRPKACGDGLTAGALRLLEGLGLDPTPISSWMLVEDVCIRSPSGRTVEFPLPRKGGQFAAVVPRAELDNALVEQAKGEGAVLMEGAACQGVSEDDGQVALEVEDHGTVTARFAIAADGMWSPTRKYLDLAADGYRGDWHAFRQYWSGVDSPASRALWVWFEEEILPGYVWSFPLPDGRANVGFGVRRGGPVAVGEMGKLWRELLERDHIRAVLGHNAQPETTHRAWPIPARIDKIPLTARRTMFTGDAAAATDPMSGEGIAQALLTGIGAANSVLAGGGEAAQVMAAYRRFVRQELFADHRMARRLGRVLATRPGARGAVRIAGLTPWTRRNFARWLFEDYPRSIITTPRRWFRKPLTTPGAYR
ncbi:geranylgeranyl reductase family protein [Candidatus Poriferisocius sp.]|uniref:geranylgeranyl reductase family protein n=1 Tax=Candidatus Poriferisocius sp. TaxID=3101276 RepID=UPI003B5CDA39